VYRLLEHSFGRIEQLEPWLEGAKPTAEVAILSQLGQMTSLRIPGHSDDVEGAAQFFLETAIQFDIIDPAVTAFSGYKTLVLPAGFVVDASLKAKVEQFIARGGKLIMSGTAALDPASGKFVLEGLPVTYEAPAPTTPSYLRLDQALVGDSELATDYDYVFYEQAHLVRPVDGATAHGELRRALFNRTWEHFTSHAHAPVGASLGSPLVVEKGNILYFAAPFFRAYRNHDYWAYRAIALNALRGFLPPSLLVPSGPGWAEFTLHTQPYGSSQATRKIVHIVTYHPRRTLQPVAHVDQSWATSGLSMKVLFEGNTPQRVYLAPDRETLDFVREGDYVRIDLPPVGPHTVVVLE
jgi:hypothetical protein